MNPRRLTLAALAAAGIALALPAGAGAATQLVSPTGVDSADCTVNPCLHIQQAVNVAAVGDTVQVAAGVYNSEPSNRVLINKGLTLEGAGIGQTILDGNNAHGLPQNGTLRVNSTTGDDITIRGLTVRNAGATAGAHGADTHFGILMEGIAPTATTWTLDQVRVEGSNSATGRDYNLDVQNVVHNIVVTDSQFVDANFSAVLFERAQGTVDFNGNTVVKGPGTSLAWFAMNHIANTGNPTGITGLYRLRNNTINASGNANAVAFQSGYLGDTRGPFGPIEATGNTISGISAAGYGIAFVNSGANPGTATAIQSATASGNTITGPGGRGLAFSGLTSAITGNGNYLTGLTRGIQLLQGSGRNHGPGPASFSFNRIVDDSTAGLENSFGNAVNAENNWWGCNEGPGNDPGCTVVAGTNVDYDPWLVLGLSASPTSIGTGGQTSTITANLNFNSAGANVGTAHRDGFPVPFATDLGSVTSPGAVASGVATSTLTSGATTGTANVSATVDNETQTTQVQIVDATPPTTQIDTGPADGSTITDPTPTFTFSSPSDPGTATFECSVDGAAFADCTSPTTIGPLSDGPHTFSVRAEDGAGNYDPNPPSRSFTVDTTPPDTEITSGPTGGVTIANSTATFAFESPTDPTATFECRLDSAEPSAWSPCTSPFTTPALTEGAHVFEVRAVDGPGNVDPSPARGAFVVDTTPDVPGTTPGGGVGGGGVAGAEAGSPLAGACGNRIKGNKRANDIVGTERGDRILALGAGDSLAGRGGFDCLKGHSGDDEIDGGAATDLMQGGPGNDTLSSRDGKRDKLNCGPGDDTAIVDQRDVVKGCETLRVQVRLRP